MVTYLADEDGAITYISSQITEWTGLPAHLWTDDPTFWRTLIHPDDHDRVVAAAFGTHDTRRRVPDARARRRLALDLGA